MQPFDIDELEGDVRFILGNLLNYEAIGRGGSALLDTAHIDQLLHDGNFRDDLRNRGHQLSGIVQGVLGQALRELPPTSKESRLLQALHRVYVESQDKEGVARDLFERGERTLERYFLREAIPLLTRRVLDAMGI